MSDHELSDESVDRVLDGRDVAGESGAETVGAAAALFRRASGQATTDELDAADATISRFTELVLEPETAAPARRLRSVPMPARAAVLIAAATLWSTGVAAAATGHLPHPIQNAVSQTASHVGLNLPGGEDNGSSADSNGQGQDNGKGKNQGEDTTSTTTATTSAPTTGESTTASTAASTTDAPTTGGPTTTSAVGASAPTSGGQVRGVGPDVTGPAGDALCKAWNDAAARGKPKNPDAPPWRNLLAASKASGKSIDELCGTTTTTTAATVASASSPTTTAAPTTSTASTTSTLQAEGTSNGGDNGQGNGNGNANGAGNGNGGGNGNGNGNGNGHSSHP